MEFIRVLFRSWLLRADEPFHAASTMKVAVLIELSLPCLAIELDQDRHLHGAGGVKRLVGAQQPFRLAVERPKRHGHVRAASLNDGLQARNGGSEPRSRRGGAVPPEEGSERKQQSPSHQARHVPLAQLGFSSSP